MQVLVEEKLHLYMDNEFVVSGVRVVFREARDVCMSSVGGLDDVSCWCELADMCAFVCTCVITCGYTVVLLGLRSLVFV